MYFGKRVCGEKNMRKGFFFSYNKLYVLPVKIYVLTILDISIATYSETLSFQ